jgi:rSAM/selenodomain-associated transferase 1
VTRGPATANLLAVNHLTIFARPPVAGRVKTRLSPALPEALAARLYGALLADTLSAGAASRADARVVAWSETRDAPPAPAAFAAALQEGADLGARLAHAFTRAFAAGARRAVIVGSDAPAMTAAHLDGAFDALASHDLVLGPATDGGYWLVGLSRAAPELFEGVPWSTPEVAAVTLSRARGAGLRVAAAPTLPDLDTPADLAALVGACAGTGETACGPRTREALRTMGLVG